MATFSQKIIWTVLPNGVLPGLAGDIVKGKRLFAFSVMVSPRLMTDTRGATLGLFPDFANWPAAHFAFKVQFGKDNPVVATRTSPAPDSKLWTAIFQPTLAVRSYIFQRLDKNFVFSYPAASIHDFLKENYRQLSAKASLPAVSQILDPKRFGSIVLRQPFNPINPTHAVPRQPLATRLKTFKDDLKQPAAHTGSEINQPGPLGHFLKLLLFHQPRTPDQVRDVLPNPDFHDLIAHLGEYPLLLRHLGLVIDFSVPAPATSSDLVMFVPEFKTVGKNSVGVIQHTDITPRTRYVASGSFEFRAADEPTSDHDKGWLKLNDKKNFAALQIDADGGGLKAFNFANSLAEANERLRTADTPQQAGLPALRSGGISVVRNERATQFTNKMRRAAELNAAAEKGVTADPSQGIILTNEDLMRGYRIDVREGATPWRSLCARQERYVTQGGLGVTSPNEEGYISASVTSDASTKTPANEKDLYLQETILRWEGWSLCVRRPGLPLARSADEQKLIEASQPVPSSDPSSEGKTIPLKTMFSVVDGTLPRLRFGGKYQLRARTVDLAGNGRSLADTSDTTATPPITYLRFEPVAPPRVLRGTPTKDGDSLERVVFRSGPAIKEDETARRHIAPPPVAQLLAETHGVFDNLAPDVAYKIISERDHEIKDNPTAQIAEKFLKEFPSKESGATQHLYLPDPAASGVLASSSTTGLIESGMIPFYKDKLKDWPNFTPFTIELKGAPEGAKASTEFDKQNRVLRVLLPPAATMRILLSSQLTKEDMLKMGVLQWILELIGLENIDLNKLDKNLTNGFSSINPFRELVLIHVVQQPLKAPEITQVKAVRQRLGQTTAALSGTISIHGASTAKVDVLAEWNEFSGHGLLNPQKKPVPEVVVRKAHLGELPVAASASQVSLAPAVAQHEFGDSKHRVVRYQAEATTRFREYFLGKLKDNPDLPLTLSSAASTSVNQVSIPSSARPAPPKVQYVIPTFGWAKKVDAGTQFLSVRMGGGLRVYLDDPWYSSGEGELLGVILGNLPFVSRMPERVRPFVTQWGQDPVWSGLKKMPTFNSPEMFWLSKAKAPSLPLDEIPNPKTAGPESELVSVVGYDVNFDGERWYSDIFMAMPIAFYFPFVRLALARYQPESLQGAHLSRVVTSDFMQLPPSRATYLKINTTAAKAKKAGSRKALNLNQIVTEPQFIGDAGNLQTVIDGMNVSVLMKSSLSIVVAGVTHRNPNQNVVNVMLQRATSPRKSDLDWEPASEILPLTFIQDPKGAAPGLSAWTGELKLPDNFKPGSYRVLVSEMEQFITDTLDQSGRAIPPVLFEIAPGVKVSTEQPKPARVVYLDTIEI